ncbi:MAG TPA: YciI family protein [Rhizomicrobium sp.]
MQYILMAYVQENGWNQMTKDQQEQGMAAYMMFTDAMNKAAILRGSNRLGPSSNATTVRIADGRTLVLDGPYAESKEQFGGYFIIEVPDLDAALAWAARCPAAGHGIVEVRPLNDMAR